MIHFQRADGKGCVDDAALGRVTVLAGAPLVEYIERSNRAEASSTDALAGSGARGEVQRSDNRFLDALSSASVYSAAPSLACRIAIVPDRVATAEMKPGSWTTRIDART